MISSACRHDIQHTLAIAGVLLLTVAGICTSRRSPEYSEHLTLSFMICETSSASPSCQHCSASHVTGVVCIQKCSWYSVWCMTTSEMHAACWVSRHITLSQGACNAGRCLPSLVYLGLQEQRLSIPDIHIFKVIIKIVLQSFVLAVVPVVPQLYSIRPYLESGAQPILECLECGLHYNKAGMSVVRPLIGNLRIEKGSKVQVVVPPCQVRSCRDHSDVMSLADAVR